MSLLICWLKDDQDNNPEAHALLLSSIQRLQLMAKNPAETAKRILYEVRLFLIFILSAIRHRTADKESVDVHGTRRILRLIQLEDR